MSEQQGKPLICSWCGKPLFGEIARPGDRPGWCHDCSTTYGDVAIIVCSKCGATLGGILPGLHDSGYFVKPNEILHANGCPKCTPGDPQDTVMRFTVEEFEKAMEKNNEREAVRKT